MNYYSCQVTSTTTQQIHDRNNFRTCLCFPCYRSIKLQLHEHLLRGLFVLPAYKYNTIIIPLQIIYVIIPWAMVTLLAWYGKPCWAHMAAMLWAHILSSAGSACVCVCVCVYTQTFVHHASNPKQINRYAAQWCETLEDISGYAVINRSSQLSWHPWCLRSQLSLRAK